MTQPLTITEEPDGTHRYTNARGEYMHLVPGHRTTRWYALSPTADGSTIDNHIWATREDAIADIERMLK